MNGISFFFLTTILEEKVKTFLEPKLDHFFKYLVCPYLTTTQKEFYALKNDPIGYELEFIENPQMATVAELATIFNVTRAVASCINDQDLITRVKLLFALLKHNKGEVEDEHLPNLIKENVILDKDERVYGVSLDKDVEEYLIWVRILFLRSFSRYLPADWIYVTLCIMSLGWSFNGGKVYST